MNISVRVLSAQAQAQIKALQAQVAGLQKQLAATSATSGASPLGSARSRKSLAAWGNQIQWTGRQLQYNWTLPLAIAGFAATKFALDNEKAFTRVSKVYGDAADATAWYLKHQEKIPEGMTAGEAAAAGFRNELEALQQSFEALSNMYGVNQKDVLETAGAWAAAGQSGVDLARSVELSLKAAVLGDMDLAKATDALISIQSQYTLNTKQLGVTLDELNAIENQTGISMQGLIDGFSRSAGVAREYGVDVRHLGAMLAALVPATGSATTAGNALKTIMSRVMAPTQQARDVMYEFGVETSDAVWQSSTAMERLMILAGHMNGTLEATAEGGYKLSDSQKAVVGSVLGSNYQVNRFLVLMRELGPDMSYYEKALQATSDRTKVFNQAQSELQAVLSSSPKRLQIMWTILQNGMADAIQPLIPYIIYLAQEVAKLVTWFSNLDPAVQKIALMFAVALAAVGPLVKYFGSLNTLIGTLIIPFQFLFARIAAVRAAWIALMTTEKLVEGVMVTTRLSLLGVIWTMLKMPFEFVISGFKKMLGAMLIFSRGLPFLIASSRATWVAIQSVWVVAWTRLKVLSTLGALAQITTFTKLRVALVTVSMAMWRSIALVWSGGMAAIALFAGTQLTKLIALVVRFGKFFVSPWGIALLAVLGLFALFHDQIAQVWNNIVDYFGDSSNQMTQLVLRAWNALPGGITNALVAVARVVQKVALEVYGWFSYLNPFAHHSPSLVENVWAGTGEIVTAFGNMRTGIKGQIAGAYGEVKAFGAAVKKITGGAASFQEANDRRKIKKFAPGALDEYDALIKRLHQLEGALAKQKTAVDAQDKVVERWKNKLYKANQELDKQQKKLDKLQLVEKRWQEALDKANDSMDFYTDRAVISGMTAMSDAIFDNEMAQKRLQLAMMDMEDVYGPLDEIKSKLEAINGAQEMLSGEKSALRSAGAGSDILSFYDDQISALEQQKNTQTDAAKAMDDMDKALKKLQRDGERLDLTNSLKFDPLTRQIEAASKAMVELPFETIIAGVRKSRGEIDLYTSKLDQATQAVKDQQAVVDAQTNVRDKIQDHLDAEQRKLDRLKDTYDDINDAVQAINSSLSGAASAADALAQAKKAKKKKTPYVSPAVQNFRDAAGGDFAVAGGEGIPIRKNWADQSKEIEDFTKEISDRASKAFSDINPFTAIKSKWGSFKTWWSGAWDDLSSATTDMLGAAFKGIGLGDAGKMADGFRIAWAKTSDWFKDNVVDKLAAVWHLLGPSFSEIWDNLVDGFKEIGKQVGPALKELGEEFTDIGKALEGAWNVAKPFLAVLGGEFLIGLKVGLSMIAKVLKPILKTVGDVLENLIQIIKGALQIISGFFMLFTDDWREGLKKMASGVLNIISGLFGAIGQLIAGAVKVVIGLVWGFVKGIWDFFKWIYDELVGHSIVPDLINGIITWFKKIASLVAWVWDNFVQPVLDIFLKLFDLVIAGLELWWDGFTTAWDGLTAAATWFWDNVLGPVWDFVSSVWSDYIEPALKLWWAGFKAEWDALKKAGQWFWDNILKPIWNKVQSVWRDYIKPAFGAWWEGVKTAWQTFKNAGQWIWDNVLSPIWNKVTDLWGKIKSEVGEWYGRITNIWSTGKNALSAVGSWIKNNVTDPIFDRMTGVWSRISEWMDKNKDALLKPMKSILNGIVSVVNAVIKGLNKISDLLPGDINWSIPTIELASGGPIAARRANRGFKTSGARAIVGEGKANYPEFVIPTDPTYRNRAKSLLAVAASKMGIATGADLRGARGDTAKDFARVAKENPAAAMDAIPQFGIGGWLGDAWKAVKSKSGDTWDWFKEKGRKVIAKMMNPLFDAAHGVVNKAPWKPAKLPPDYSLNKMQDWVAGVNEGFQNAFDDAKKNSPTLKASGALAWARSQVGKPYQWGGVGPDGYDCSGFMSAITNVIQGRSPYSRVGSTASFPWPGFRYGVQPGFTIGSTRSYAGGIGHMAGTLGGVNVESRGGTGVIVGSGARGWSDPGFSTHAYLAMKEGGIAVANRGPILAAIGDGRYDEAVVPLPRGFRDNLIGSTGGDTIININGNLEFPNIKSGDDAQTFIENLESMAGG